MNALPSPAPSSRRARRQSSLAAQRAKRLAEGEAIKSLAARPVQPEARLASTKLWESGMVLGVNVVLIGTAITTLMHLVPFQLAQQTKLKEIRAEESNLAKDVQMLKQSYELNQSSEGAQRVAQQQGNLIPPNQVNVIVMPPNSAQQ